MTTRWTSPVLGRLDLTPEDAVDRVLHRSGLPETAVGREVVDLHLCSLDVSLGVDAPGLFVPHMEWEANRWEQLAASSAGLRVWAAVRDVLAEHLDELGLLSVARHVEEADALAADRAARRTRDATGLAALSEETTVYLAHAVAGRHTEAVDLVLALADAGWSVPELLLGVIAPAQDELGRLWERGALSVAQEHMATAVSHLAMYALYPRLFVGPRLGLALVAATAPGDRHSLGLRMVTDLLQHRGWDAVYVGGPCPVGDVLDTVVHEGAALLLLGASMTCHLPALREAVAQLRGDPRCDEVRVMVGGAPFREAPALGEWVGADLAAGHGPGAVRAAESLLGSLLASEAPSRR